VLLGWVLTRLFPAGVGPDLSGGGVSPTVQFVGIAIFSPVLETMLMAGALSLLLRWLQPWQAAVVSAIGWGLLHSSLAPLWGLVIWWPFLIFSTLYVTWRPRGWWTAVAIVSAVHILQNTGPAALIALG
jgi:membrane protease YdiL (CAAX protease family)